MTGPDRAAALGSPIAHSLSPALHSAAYAALGLDGWTYAAIECDEEQLPGLLASCDSRWAGLSLTMPLKRAVLPLLDYTEPLAAEVGGANTVVFSGGQRRGYNTDVPGMVAALAEAGVRVPVSATILGAGATACAALAALRALGLATVVVQVRDAARAGDLLAAARRLRMAVELRPFGSPPSRPEPPILTPNGPVILAPGPAPCSTWCMTPGPPRWPRPRPGPASSGSAA
jgi:shikimate dehydrogenase